MKKPRVAIVGAGVSGLTCAVLLSEQRFRVAIFAAETGQRTTSAAAGAIWFPYDAEPFDKVIAWSLVTYEWLRDLARDPRSGVSMIELRSFARTGDLAIPDWARSLGGRRLQLKAPLGGLRDTGFSIRVPLTDTTLYLDYLADRVRRAGGEIHSPVHVRHLEEVSPEFEIVVNCSGIGARSLAGDADLEPHRGQIVVVPKMDLPYALACDDPPLMYVIPRTNDCVLGGTNEISDDRNVNPLHTEAILAECARVLTMPAPPIIAERVGLRPFRRSGIRLEAERLRDGRTVIHNYGHGGSGFTLSRGCAEEVARLIAAL